MTPEKILCTRVQSIMSVFCHKSQLYLKLKTYDVPIYKIRYNMVKWAIDRILK